MWIMSKRNMKKNLYCKKCWEYPDTITEVYREPYREWNGECYELQDTNLEMMKKLKWWRKSYE